MILPSLIRFMLQYAYDASLAHLVKLLEKPIIIVCIILVYTEYFLDMVVLIGVISEILR